MGCAGDPEKKWSDGAVDSRSSRQRFDSRQTLTNLRSVIPLVVEGGFCIGCGACAAAPDSPLTMDVGSDGMYRPVDRATRSSIIGTDDLVPVALDVVCPFSNSAADEDELSTLDFGDGARHPAIGRHEAIWAGHVSDDDFRLAGTSGGMTTSISGRTE